MGFVLIPVALKLASSGYRAQRYYTHDPTYRAAGPPELLPRLLAPLLVLAVVTALGTGLALFAQRSRSGVLGTLHTDAAVATAVLVAAYLLTYVPDALATIGREVRVHLPQRAARVAAAGAALALGISLAPATYGWGVWPPRHHDRRLGTGIGWASPAGTGAAGTPVLTGVRGASLSGGNGTERRT